MGRVAVRHILKQGFWIDRATSLPVEDRQGALHARVEVKGPGVSAFQAINSSLDGERFQRDLGRPVLPTLDCPDRDIRQTGLWSRILRKHGPKVPLDSRVNGRPDC